MPAGPDTDEVELLETNLDDTSAEIIADTLDRLFQAGALDAWTQPVYMKKNRPGVLLSVLCRPEQAEAMVVLLLTHTTAFGVRHARWARWILRRDFQTVETAYGAIQVKCGHLGSKRVQASPEYESCRAAAERFQVPVRAVYTAALRALEDTAWSA